MRLPDQVLGSRSIVVPLIRTPDRYRANADPLDYETWPHDRCQLIDDLWALGLAHLPELPEHDAYVARAARLTGCNLQPWQAILAVAAWLDARGMGGLWNRMTFLSSRDATRARYPLTLIWPADAQLAAINDQWQRLDDGRIQATYNTPDELALCLWPFPAPGPLHGQPAYVQPPLSRSPDSTGQGMENLR
jgi:hypothetical protein